MFSNFEKLFCLEDSEPYDERYDELENLRIKFAGETLCSGLLRILKREDVVCWRTNIALAFPKFAGKYEPFAFDWLGRFFCVKKDESSKASILIFNPFLNRCFIVGCNLLNFLEHEIPNNIEKALLADDFLEWLENNEPLEYTECLAFKRLYDYDDKSDTPSLSDTKVFDIHKYWVFLTMLIDSRPYNQILIEHYQFYLGKKYDTFQKTETVMYRKYPEFSVIKYPPTDEFPMYRYATVGMSFGDELNAIELYMVSQFENDHIIDILTWVAFYHKEVEKFKVDDTINFGVPWFTKSNCDYGLVCMPFIDSPEFKDCGDINCMWLLPITKEESDYKEEFGVYALEEKFGECELNFIDFFRDSVI